MQNFLGRCKNGEYVNNFVIIFVLIFFLIYYTSKMRDQHLARFLSFSVRSWIALRYLFFSNGFEINLLYSQLSLNKHLTDNPQLLAPVIVQSFDCNYALCNTETSQRRTTNTFETTNGQLRNALGSEKYRKTEM